MKIDLNSPVLEVKFVGEKGSCIMEAALDTGSTYTIIPWKIAKKLGYHPELAEERANIITASGTELTPLITIKAIEVLGSIKENVKVACHDLPPQATISVLLGFDFLKGFSTRLDFKDGKEGELEIIDP